MIDTIRLGDIAIAVTRKAVKHVHLSVHPPGGRVSMAKGSDSLVLWCRRMPNVQACI